MMNNHLLNEMEAAGLVPAETLDRTNNGELQRFQVAGDKRGTKNGWLISYYNAGASTVHIFGSWKAGFNKTVVEGGDSKVSFETRQLVMEAQREAYLRKERQQSEVAIKCARIWDSLPQAESHSYLTRKGIKSHSARCQGGDLVIPLFDFNATITSLQFIKPDGAKVFSKGGKVIGSFCPLGGAELASSKTWVICEGFATGASIHEATGLPVLVAFNANNLTPIATSLRLRSATAQIIIAADNDRFTSTGNVGIRKAESAARDSGAFAIMPIFDTGEGTDFNDLAQQKGLQTISKVFKEVVA